MDMTKIVQQPVVESERFVLRPLRRADQGMIDLFGGDARVARMTTSLPHPLPPGLSEALVSRAMADDRDADVWAIDGQKTGAKEFMGLITLTKLDRNQSEVTYWVAPPYWNTGIASEALSVLVGTNPLGNDTMFATAFQDNPASARVLIQCGFEYLGDAETFCVARDTNVPTWTYSRTLSD